MRYFCIAITMVTLAVGADLAPAQTDLTYRFPAITREEAAKEFGTDKLPLPNWASRASRSLTCGNGTISLRLLRPFRSDIGGDFLAKEAAHALARGEDVACVDALRGWREVSSQPSPKPKRWGSNM